MEALSFARSEPKKILAYNYVCSHNDEHKHMRTPEISPSEWKVMKVLWAKAPQPAYDIIHSLAETEDWHPNTVKTLLSRLCKKKAVGARKYKNLYLYHPLVTESD